MQRCPGVLLQPLHERQRGAACGSFCQRFTRSGSQTSGRHRPNAAMPSSRARRSMTSKRRFPPVRITGTGTLPRKARGERGKERLARAFLWGERVPVAAHFDGVDPVFRQHSRHPEAFLGHEAALRRLGLWRARPARRRSRPAVEASPSTRAASAAAAASPAAAFAPDAPASASVVQTDGAPTPAASSRSRRSSAQFNFTRSGKRSPTALRQASTTSARKRTRFSMEPP